MKCISLALHDASACATRFGPCLAQQQGRATSSGPALKRFHCSPSRTFLTCLCRGHWLPTLCGGSRSPVWALSGGSQVVNKPAGVKHEPIHRFAGGSLLNRVVWPGNSQGNRVLRLKTVPHCFCEPRLVLVSTGPGRSIGRHKCHKSLQGGGT